MLLKTALTHPRVPSKMTTALTRTAFLVASFSSAVAFLPSPPARGAALTRCRADRLSLPGVVRIDDKGEVFLGKASKPLPPPPAEPTPRWAEPIDQFFERIESTKAAVAGLFAGSVAATAPSLLLHLDNIGQFEFNIDQIAIMSALFAVVYRYAVRADGNPQLKQGVVAAFVVTRTLGAVRVPSYCPAVPLQCGEPLGYLNWDMLEQIGSYGVESAAAFGATAVTIEWLCDRRLLGRFGEKRGWFPWQD